MSPQDQFANLMYELMHGVGYLGKYAGQIDPANGDYGPIYDNILNKCLQQEVPNQTLTGSKNRANPLKRRGRLVWFFMHFRGPQALGHS
jgi:hypothetical protein